VIVLHPHFFRYPGATPAPARYGGPMKTHHIGRQSARGKHCQKAINPRALWGKLTGNFDREYRRGCITHALRAGQAAPKGEIPRFRARFSSIFWNMPCCPHQNGNSFDRATKSRRTTTTFAGGSRFWVSRLHRRTPHPFGPTE